MRLSVRGHPLHARALAVSLRQRADGKLDAEAYILDLRKCGFVPVAGDLQPPGIIHHMQLVGIVDPTTATLESLAAAQPAVAFESSQLTKGENCRDPIARVAGLAGTRFDGHYARRVSAEIGGPRGCSHLLTLAQTVGSAIARGLDCDRLLQLGARRRAGERVFRRDVVIDGYRAESGSVDIAVQLTDLHFAPAEPVARPMERFAEQLEVRLLATVDFPAFTLRSAVAAERQRGLADFEEAVWRDRADVLAPLAGLSLWSGGSGELLRRLGDAAGDRPLLDAMLTVAPTLIQCVGALSEHWPVEAKHSQSYMGRGGLPDSCYMWRRGGALNQMLAQETEAGTVEPQRP